MEPEDPSTYEIPQAMLDYNAANLVTGGFIVYTGYKENPYSKEYVAALIDALRFHNPLTDQQRAFWGAFDVQKVIKDQIFSVSGRYMDTNATTQWMDEGGSFRIDEMLPEWAKKIYDSWDGKWDWQEPSH